MNTASRDHEHSTGSALESETWILIRDDGWHGPPRYKAARFLRQSKSRVYLVDRWGDEIFLGAKMVAVWGLTSDAAKLAAAKLQSSRDIFEQEQKAAISRASERERKIIAEASASSAKPEVSEDSRDDQQ